MILQSNENHDIIQLHNDTDTLIYLNTFPSYEFEDPHRDSTQGLTKNLKPVLAREFAPSSY